MGLLHPDELESSGKVPGFPVRNILEIHQKQKRSLDSQPVSSGFSGAEQYNHAEHHEHIPQGDEDPEVPQAQ